MDEESTSQDCEPFFESDLDGESTDGKSPGQTANYVEWGNGQMGRRELCLLWVMSLAVAHWSPPMHFKNWFESRIAQW